MSVLRSSPSSTGDNLVAMSSSTETSPRATDKICTRCEKPLPRHFVRALNASYHLECFTCLVCGQVVANRFFPITAPSGETFALCEKDYYRQLDLLCYKCDQPLHTSYISADDKKYHLDHFTCSVCPTIFGPDDVYYEEKGNIYCGEHYAQIASIKCVGCQLGILKQYIEITTDTVAEPWHPECYMIYKFWHVRIAPQVYTPTSRHESISSAVSLDKDQIVDRRPPSLSAISEEQIYSIWTILSTFEESSATCISDMLIHVSDGVYGEALNVAEKFIMHVHTIFTAIDDLEDQLAQFDDATGLQHTKEPKILCKRIIRFFALLSNPESPNTNGIEMTEELLSLVTGLAHYLKMLIRSALMGALKAEREYGSKISLNGLLHKLAEINDRETASSFRLLYRDIGVTSDLCALCQVTLEEECISHKSQRWHKACFNCDHCGRNLKTLYRKALYDEASRRILCTTCMPDESAEQQFNFVTQLEQYSFLLRVALKRLYNLLNRKGIRMTASQRHPALHGPPKKEELDGIPSSYPEIDQLPHKVDDKLPEERVQTVSAPADTTPLTNGQSMPSVCAVKGALATVDKEYEDPQVRETLRNPPSPADQTVATIPDSPGHQADLKRRPTLERHSVHEDAVKLIVISDHPSDAAAELDTVPPKDTLAAEGARPVEVFRDPQFYRPTVVEQAAHWPTRPNEQQYHRSLYPRSQTDGSLPVGHAKEVAERSESQPSDAADRRSLPPNSRGPAPMDIPPVPPPKSTGKKTLLCDLSPLEHFVAKHVAVLQLMPLVQTYVTPDELLSMVGSRKQSIWTRLKANMNQTKKPKGKVKDVVFGASIEELVERQGVESQHTTVSTFVRVPLFVELCTDALKSKNLGVEGIFRKNGNIRRLRELSDAIDNDIHSVDLSNETAVQCAALMKKFFREMAEPLLTFKLHKLFLACDKIKDEQDQRRAYHYACCLLPMPNRDCIEVLFGLLRFVAQYAHIGAEEGSLMDLGNLCTVVTPNILYSSSKDPLKDDSFAAIQVIYNLLQNQDRYWNIPSDIALVLQQEQRMGENLSILHSKDILKRVEHVFRSMKKSQSNVDSVGDRAKSPY